jgi:hypothetical protein
MTLSASLGPALYPIARAHNPVVRSARRLRGAPGLASSAGFAITTNTSHCRKPLFVPYPVFGDGRDIRTVQARLGHRDVGTTRVYTEVLNRGPAGVRSRADRTFEP